MSSTCLPSVAINIPAFRDSRGLLCTVCLIHQSKAQTIGATSDAARLCNLSETLVHRGGALAQCCQPHARHPGSLPAPLFAPKLLALLNALSARAVVRTTRQVREGGAGPAVIRPQTLSVTPTKQQHRPGPLGEAPCLSAFLKRRPQDDCWSLA